MNDELSALIVAAPEAEPLVSGLRAELDVHARWGVPAHVSVLVPFLAAADIDDGVLAAVGEVVAAVPAFTTVFRQVGWFGEDALWLGPEPAAPFVALTAALGARFGLSPYEGRYGSEPTPHLTVGHDAAPERLRAAADDLVRGLPVHAQVATVRLITGRWGAGPWAARAEFPLGPGEAAQGTMPG